MRSEVFPGDGELFFFLSSYNQQMSTTEAQIRDTCEVGCCGKAQLLHVDIDNTFGVWILTRENDSRSFYNIPESIKSVGQC